MNLKKIFISLLTTVLTMLCGCFVLACSSVSSEDASSHAHMWSNTYTDSGDRHYQTCNGCSEKQYGEHSYNSIGYCICGKVMPNIEVAGIELNAMTLKMLTGHSEKLEAIVLPSNATDKQVIWSSSDTSVATVSEGVVTAVSEGRATIYAKTTNKKYATCEVVVEKTISIQQLYTYYSEYTIEIGQTGKLEVYYYPENANDTVCVWESSNPAIATINRAFITAVKAGVTYITVTAPSGVSITVMITVIDENSVQRIDLKNPSPILVGDTIHIEGTYSPGLSNNPKFVWSSENPEIATVDQNGNVTANSVGTAVIVATAPNGVFGSCTVECRYFEFQTPDVPMIVKNYSDPAYFETQSATITNITTQLKLTTSGYPSNWLTLTIYLTKDSCIYSNSNAFKVAVKIYDKNNVVVLNSILTSNSFSVGESTIITQELYLNKAICTDGKYRIEFIAVCW